MDRHNFTGMNWNFHLMGWPSQMFTISHPSTNQAHPCLVSEIRHVQGGMAVGTSLFGMTRYGQEK